MDERRPVVFVSMFDGWAIRNTLYTGIIARLAQHCQVVAVVPDRFRRHLMDRCTDASLTVETLPCEAEPLSWRLARRLRKKLYLVVNDVATERIKEKSKERSFPQRAATRVLRPISRLPKANRLVSLAEDLDFLVNRDDSCMGMLAAHRPALVIGATPFRHAEEALMRAALRLRIPCVTYIPSWDNLSTKGVIHQRGRAVLVWNEITRQEILAGYPRYSLDQVTAIGVPQFDIYATRPAVDYATWCQRYGLDHSRRTILYCTSSPRLFAYDEIVVQRILSAVEDGRVPGDPQVLIRCHPYDTRSYEHLRKNRGVGISLSSLGPGQGQEDWFPSPDELATLRDCIFFSSVTINMASTMSLDAAVCNKPILGVAFDGDEKLPYERSARRYYDYSHQVLVAKSGAVRICYNYDELLQGITEYLDNPQRDAAARAELVERMGLSNCGHSAERFVQEVVTLVEVSSGDRTAKALDQVSHP